MKSPDIFDNSNLFSSWCNACNANTIDSDHDLDCVFKMLVILAKFRIPSAIETVEEYNISLNE